MGPAAATSLLTLGLPLIEQLAGSRASGPPLAAVPAVDLARVTGRWFKGSPVLEGDLPSPLAPPSGCVFRTRCEHATDLCATQPHWEVRGSHPAGETAYGYACHHPAGGEGDE